LISKIAACIYVIVVFSYNCHEVGFGALEMWLLSLSFILFCTSVFENWLCGLLCSCLYSDNEEVGGIRKSLLPEYAREKSIHEFYL
jgi:hypothetical protein